MKHSNGKIIFPISHDTLTLVQPVGEGLYTVSKCVGDSAIVYLLDDNGIVATLPPNTSVGTNPSSCGLLQVIVHDKKPVETTMGPANFHQAFVDHRGQIKIELPPGVCAMPFKEGLTSYSLKQGNHYQPYLINSSGKTVKLRQADTAVAEFKNGRAVLSQREKTGVKYGLVNKDGKILLSTIYDLVENYNDHTIVKIDGLFKVLDAKFSVRFVFPPDTTSVLPAGDNGWFAFGVGVTPPATSKLNETYIDTKYGYVDTRGNVKIQPQYKSASRFIGGFAIVGNPLMGTINEHGNSRIDSKFKSLRRINDLVIATIDVPEISYDNIKTDEDVEMLLANAALSPDALALRKAQRFAFAYAVVKNDKPMIAKFDAIISNRRCPVCNVKEGVITIQEYLAQTRQNTGKCGTSSFADPRWYCKTDRISF